MGELVYLHFRWTPRHDLILAECWADEIDRENIAERFGCSVWEVDKRLGMLKRKGLLIAAEKCTEIAEAKNAERFGLEDALGRISANTKKARDGTLGDA